MIVYPEVHWVLITVSLCGGLEKCMVVSFGRVSFFAVISLHFTDEFRASVSATRCQGPVTGLCGRGVVGNQGMGHAGKLRMLPSSVIHSPQS